MKLTVIIPVYNEEKTVEKLINTINSLKFNFTIEIIVIDDCSNDRSREIINSLGSKVDKVLFHKKNYGKGAAINSAKKFITGEYVIIQDADLEYNPNDYKKMLDFMKNNNLKVVYGSRVLNKNKYENSQNFSHIIRIWGNIFLTMFSNFINKQNLTDAHTCYKMFQRDLFMSLNLSEKGFSFCPEVNTKISNLNIEIKEVSIDYNGRTYDEGKKIKSIDALYAIIAILKYKFFKKK
tara:strand:- start:5319 stop:6026 length:708 start_codon:yes stop_codon:yes gene_type:complete